MKVIEQFYKTQKDKFDAGIRRLATRTRRLLWKVVFITAALSATAGTATYIGIKAVMPHVHNIHAAAQLVDGEARGEPYRGQKAVFATIVERMEDKRFPNSMHDVIFQPYSNNDRLLQYNAMGDEIHENLSTEAGQAILWKVTWWYVQYEMGIFHAPQEAQGAHSYCTPVACERQAGYFGRLTRTGEIGGHVFYGEVESGTNERTVSAAPTTSIRPEPRPMLECDEQTLAPCTSIRPKPRPQSSFLPEQSGKRIDQVVANVAMTF